MAKIQVDMFEVQLGAAMLLSFKVSGDTVRVLADAGVKASKYKPEHVLNKVNSILAGGRRRLDLMIGTHYDEDHLNGLVPIIDDKTIDLGEVWLPPVADDSAQFAVDVSVSGADLLVHRFTGEAGNAALADYLDFKRNEIDLLLELEELVTPSVGNERLFALKRAVDLGGDDRLAFFRAQLVDAALDDCDHGIDAEQEPNAIVESMREGLLRGYYPYDYRPMDILDRLKARAMNATADVPVIAMAKSRSLAHLRHSNAKDAINAAALHAVVQALGRRKIVPRCEIIDDGVPRHYRWNAVVRRFILAKSAGPDLSFSLLGPSKSLVRLHRDKLPVAETSKLALSFRGEIRSITPSNQLSYIGCFKHAEQTILVSGDAGCVDFKLDSKTYHPALLAAMKPLHVIQVAHHGGNNAHFYRVLAAAGYPEQDARSYLLLSHAYQDKFRPSDIFHDFVLATLSEGDDVKLLFTSEPKREKVADYLAAISPVKGAKDHVGDIQLQFDQEGWTVTRHAVEVSP